MRSRRAERAGDEHAEIRHGERVVGNARPFRRHDIERRRVDERQVAGERVVAEDRLDGGADTVPHLDEKLPPVASGMVAVSPDDGGAGARPDRTGDPYPALGQGVDDHRLPGTAGRSRFHRAPSRNGASTPSSTAPPASCSGAQ